jgi:hypothetical protein
MSVRYSAVLLENSPTRNPFGSVVVKPTRNFSAIVDRYEPRNEYLMNEFDWRFIPISIVNFFSN